MSDNKDIHEENINPQDDLTQNEMEETAENMTPAPSPALN